MISNANAITHTHVLTPLFPNTMQFTNYDVLIESSDDDTFRLAHENYCGNKRFVVLLNIHQASYSKAKAENHPEECERVVNALIKIVSQECDPNGRFLEHVQEKVEGEDEWKEIGKEQAAYRLHQAFSMYDYKLNKIFHGETVETTYDQQDAALKRRRRGSYAKLRRSISESMLNTRMQDPSFLQELIDFDCLDLEEVKEMDVVFSVLNDAVTVSATIQNSGCARFVVSIDMVAAGYVSSTSSDERLSIVQDLVLTVQNGWGGRFLIQEPSGFRILPEPEAQEIVAQALGGTFLSPSPNPEPVPSAAPFGLPIIKSFGFSGFARGVASFRLAAIHSLKQRKEKKEIANRMGKFAKGNSDSKLIKGNGGTIARNGIFFMAR